MNINQLLIFGAIFEISILVVITYLTYRKRRMYLNSLADQVKKVEQEILLLSEKIGRDELSKTEEGRAILDFKPSNNRRTDISFNQAQVDFLMKTIDEKFSDAMSDKLTSYQQALKDIRETLTIKDNVKIHTKKRL